MGRDIFKAALSSLLKVPSNLILSTSNNGASTTSLGNLFKHLMTFTVKNFILVSNLNLTSYSLNHCPLW